MHRSFSYGRPFAAPSVTALLLTALLLTALLLTALLLASGCDPTVTVLDPSDRYRYSLFGTLNVAADTQSIRVEPLGDSTQFGAPPSIDATVRLENLASGEQVTLRDSFVVVGTRGDRVHNFWTTYPIEPATSYRISVVKEGEPVTTATTTTPTRAPSLAQDNAFYYPCVYRTTASDSLKAENSFVVTARNVERIAAADVIYPITYDLPDRGVTETLNRFSHYGAVTSTPDGFEIPIFYREELKDLNPEPPTSPPTPPRRVCIPREYFTVPYALVAVTAGGPDWPSWRGVSLNVIARPDTFTNVEGGHGYVAGIYSDTIRVPIRNRPE